MTKLVLLRRLSEHLTTLREWIELLLTKRTLVIVRSTELLLLSLEVRHGLETSTLFLLLLATELNVV
jgi:hypothetical protein